MTESGYTLDNSWENAPERLELLGRNDPNTIRCLNQIEVTEGWHCLELGAGRGTIAEYLCLAVGKTGRVVATDINTRFLDELKYDNLEVWEHNIVTDELPAESFDLAHARNFLLHIPERKQVIQKVKEALKPGGWILLQDGNFTTLSADPSAPEEKRELFDEVTEARLSYWRDIGVDTSIGRKEYSLLAEAGFECLDAEGSTNIQRGGSETARFIQLTVQQLRDRVLATGKVTAKKYDAYIALLDDPTFAFHNAIQMRTWGRKPEN